MSDENMAGYTTAYVLDPELSMFASNDDEMIAGMRGLVPPKNVSELIQVREQLNNSLQLGNPADFDVTRTAIAMPVDGGMTAI